MELATFIYLAVLAIWVVWPALLIHFDTTFYRDYKKYVSLSIPPVVFPIVWTPLYVCITVAEMYHILRAPSPLTVLWIATGAVYLFNLTLNHQWSVLFFQKHALVMAFVSSILIFSSAVTTLVLYGVDGHWTSFWWYLAYPIWCLFATILSGIWATNKNVREKMGLATLMEKRK